MNPHSTIWKFAIFFSFSIFCCPLLPCECKSRCGNLTVEPAPLFILGSNLTVYCNITRCQQRQEWSTISLELDSKAVAQKKVNSNTVVFVLPNIWTPQSSVRCVLQSELWNSVVSGLDLRGGLPPDKPKNVICETSRSSDFIDCTWEKGQETYIQTVYNISINNENGTQMLSDQVQNAVTIPRAQMNEDAKYQLMVTAYNPFGASQSDPVILRVKDIVIPDTPRILQIKFRMDPVAALLQWKTNDSSEHLRSHVRLRTDNGSWEAGETTEISEGWIQVKNLKFLTEYKFQMTTCNSTSGLMHNSMSGFTPRSATRKRSYCSKWSPSVRATSPGKGPSELLHVWRMLGRKRPDGLQVVTVLWKPPSPEDYSGEVRQYKIFLDDDRKQSVTCGAALSRWLVHMPADVQALSVSAVTSYGTSPPADVPLRLSGDAGPVLRVLAPEDDGSSVLVSWSWPRNKHWAKPGEMLHYVLEWTAVPVTELRWQKLSKDCNSTSITGLTAGVRYNISLYAVTSRGVSVPSSHLIYSKEQKPVSGPNMSALVHEARRIWIQWEEVPVIQQRGFITNYTIYVQTLDSSNTENSVMVSASNPRQRWLDCPEAALALQMTASTSEGEGPPGNRISSQPATPAVGLVIVIVFTFAIFIAIIANLMCCSCVKQRIKQKCISWRPAWLDEKFPKPGNSVAIRLLEHDGGEPTFSSTYSDPPLSPISLLSQEERNDLYPNVHVKMSEVGSGQSSSETLLRMSSSGTLLVGSQMEHVSYKPQIASLAACEEEVMEIEEEQRDMPTSGEEDRCSSVFGGFMSSVEVGLSESALGLTLSSGSIPLWPKTPQTASALIGGVLLGRKSTEDDVEADCPSLYSQQGEIMTCDTADTCLSQFTIAATLTGGYFPQVVAVSSTTVCDTDVGGMMGMIQTAQPALPN